jgi:ubiquinone/menaquinone biosynthesis C-methylase UbiE
MRFLFKPLTSSSAVAQRAAEKPTYLERLAQHGIDSAHPGGFTLTHRLLSQENPGAETVVLDVGCGTGQTAAYLGQHYPCKIVAVDLNPQMVALARHKFDELQLNNINLLQADATALPFRGKSFDLILSESVTIFTSITTALKEYYRVLKPGGRLLAIETTAGGPLTAAELALVQQILGVKQLPTLKLWQQMFTDAGFATVQILGQSRINPAGLGSHLTNRFFRDYHQLLLKYHSKLKYGIYRCQK